MVKITEKFTARILRSVSSASVHSPGLGSEVTLYVNNDGGGTRTLTRRDVMWKNVAASSQT